MTSFLIALTGPFVALAGVALLGQGPELRPARVRVKRGPGAK